MMTANRARGWQLSWALAAIAAISLGCEPGDEPELQAGGAGGEATGGAGAAGVGGDGGGVGGSGGPGGGAAGVGGTGGAGAAAGAGGAGAAGGSGGAGGEPAPDAAALYAQHCAACHGPARLGGVGPALDTIDWARDRLLTKVADTMPPASPDACAGQCAEAITDWLLALAEDGGGGPDCAEAPLELPPRRLRLLTRREYDNSVRDLLWPEAAEAEICGEATFVFDPRDEPNARTVHIAGTFNDWPPTIGGGGLPMQYDPGSGTWRLTAVIGEGIHRYKFVVDEARWYHDAANDWSEADGFGGLNSVVELRCGGAAGIPAGRPSRSFPPEVRPTEFPFDNHVESATVSSVHLDEYLNAAETLAEAAVADALPCNGGDACIDRLLDELAARAFRRPLTADERGRYRALFGEDGFEAGATRFVAAVLGSPHFLYRSELGEAVGDGTWRLTGYETATALAYFLWGTLPDAALVQAAEAGELGAPEGVERHARRMLADTRARATLGTFAEQWLGIEPLLETTRSGDFDETLRSALLAETRRFVSSVTFDGPHRFEDLLTAEHTFVNDVIARHYGMAPVDGAALREAPAPAARRAGILGHGAVLATHAHADQSSPIRRGLFVRNRLLCQPLPPAPPNAGGVPDVDPNATTRERFRQHTDDPFCAACHQYIDDVGFGFEHFDHLGAWRDAENGQPIDARGNMNDIEGLGTSTSAPFEGLAALGAELAASHAARACFVTQTQRFALGVDEPGHCEVEALTTDLVAAGDDIRELLVLVVTAPSFTLRTEEAQ